MDNTFYWVTEEGYRQGQPTTGTQTYYVPTAAERLGDFTADGTATLYDPTVASATNTRTVTFASECGGYNVIPGSPGAAAYGQGCGGLNYWSGVGGAIANSFNAPTGASTYGQNTYNFNAGSLGFKTRADEYVGKLEHQFFSWWTSQISYLHSAVQEPQDTPINETNAFVTGAEKEDRKFDSTAWNNTFTINASTLLTVSYGYNRYFSAFPYYSDGFNLSNFNGSGSGFGSAFTSNVPFTSFPAVYLGTSSNTNALSTSTVTQFSNGFSLPALGGAYGGPTPQASHNFVTVLSKTVAKHNFRFGYTYRGFSYFTSPPNTPGAFLFSGQYTDSTGNAASNATGYSAIADLELGLPSALNETLYAGPFINRISYNAVFVQDDFRLSQKLTFNAGLRYEYELGQHEENNKFNVGFSPTVPISYVNSANTTLNLTGGLLFAGVNGAPTHCCDNSHVKFSPRIGVAFQAFKNTVVHAGYGFFYAPIGITTTYNQGYSQITSPAISTPLNGNSITSVPAGQVGGNACLSNPFYQGTCSGGLLQPSGNSLGALTGLGGSLTAFDSKRKDPLVQQYMLDVQQKLPGDFIMTVSYIGAHATHFALPVNINQLPNSAMAAAYASNTVLSSNTVPAGGTNPYYAATVGGLPTTGVVHSQTSLQLGQTELPFPYYGSITLYESVGYGWYNSLAFKIEKRVTNGLTLLSTYTYASNWDNIYNGIGVQSPNATTSGPQDNTNINGEYSRSEDSIPNRWTLAVTEVLPVGKGKKYFGNPSGFVGKITDAVVGGWEVNYEQLMSNGIPLTVTQSNMNTQFGPSGTGGSVQRPTLVGDIHDACYGGSPQTRLGKTVYGTEKYYLNSAGLTATQPYHYGNAPRTLPCRAPGYNSATASLAKYLVNIHGFKLQYRIEALNLWNTPQFGAPSTTYAVAAPSTPDGTATVSGTNSLGSVTSQAGFSRIIQMGARLTF